jgi:hypothetical protein
MSSPAGASIPLTVSGLMTMLGVQTEGERELRETIANQGSRIVVLEAQMRWLLTLSGEDPESFQHEAVDAYMTALEAKHAMEANHD